MQKIIIGIILLAVVIVGFSIFNNKDVHPETEREVTTDNQTETQEVAEVENGDRVIDMAQENSTASGMYTMYDGDLSKYENKDVVLFFKARWCPSCRVLDADIKESLNDIPENVVLLELNYDTETELKKTYGVTTQHTMIQVDTNGTMIKKWSGGNRLEDVLNQID